MFIVLGKELKKKIINTELEEFWMEEIKNILLSLIKENEKEFWF